MTRTALILAGLALAGPLHALELSDCTRTTHVSHGGEAEHVDLGEGRVMWRDWWSQEGTALTIKVMDCAPGKMLSALVAEDNMNARPTLNKTQEALDVIATHERGARAFATLDRMAADLGGIARDVAIETQGAEACACAALYPELRGDKTEFRLQRL